MPRPIMQRYLGDIAGPLEMGRSVPFWLVFAAAVAIGAGAPLFVSLYQLVQLSDFMISVFLALGLCLIWGYTGILSLGQSAFFGLGGYIYGIVGINLLESQENTNLALIVGLASPVLIAAVLGLVMFYARIQGVYVAILMFVFTLLIQAFLNQTAGEHWHIGIAHLGGNNGLGRFSGEIREPPSIAIGYGSSTIEFGGQTYQFYYLTFTLLVLTYLGLRWLVNSRFGHILVAIRENPDRTETFGYDVRLIQLAVFCLSALISALSGILYVSWGNFITPDVFGVYSNVLPVIWVAVGGRQSLTATVISTFLLVWLSHWLGLHGDYAMIILGGILIVSMMLMPDGVITGIAGFFARWRGDRGTEVEATANPEVTTQMAFAERGIARDQRLLETRALTKSFGGVQAMIDLNLAVSAGELRCILGPNGAGKSTLFRLLMGTYPPDSGAIIFKGQDITRMPPYRRAHMGIGIKFQNMDVYQNLTVRHNLSVPLQHSHRSAEIDIEIARLLDMLHLSGTQERLVSELSHGQRQWLAIGMAIAMRPSLLLLDEPTAGMGPVETKGTGELIKRLNAEGVTILVIEHDMGFVRQLGVPITVLHYGRLFAEGSLAEITDHADVRRIYLGSMMEGRARRRRQNDGPARRTALLS
jgi:branched-chain amino acid transport system permease protein